MTQAITSSKFDGLRLKRRNGVQSRLVDGEMIVLDREHDLIHQFNKVATFIWEQCDGQRSVAEIANAVCDNFEVDDATAVKEVVETLEKLQDLELIGNDQTDRQTRKEN
jgi:methyltransferase-like protein